MAANVLAVACAAACGSLVEFALRPIVVTVEHSTVCQGKDGSQVILFFEFMIVQHSRNGLSLDRGALACGSDPRIDISDGTLTLRIQCQNGLNSKGATVQIESLMAHDNAAVVQVSKQQGEQMNDRNDRQMEIARENVNVGDHRSFCPTTVSRPSCSV